MAFPFPYVQYSTSAISFQEPFLSGTGLLFPLSHYPKEWRLFYLAEKKDRRGRKLPPNVTQRPDGVYRRRKTVDGKAYRTISKDLGALKRNFLRR